MTPNSRYAVFLFPPALEALGDRIKPCLTQGEGEPEPYFLCSEIDSSGALFQMSVCAHGDGKERTMNLMIPGNMVRLVMSTKDEQDIGFT